MKKIEEVKINMDSSILTKIKNPNGVNGPVCNNCGGYGFTMKLKGGTLDCNDCQKSGVREMTNLELQNQVLALTKDIKLLREALLKDLGFKSVKVPDRIMEANHV